MNEEEINESEISNKNVDKEMEEVVIINYIKSVILKMI